jgi:hypothetical protein
MVGMLRAQRQAFWDLVRAGLWAKDAAEAVWMDGGRGQRWFAQCGGVMEPRSTPTGR